MIMFQAHLHHYTRVEGMEMDLFQESLESMSSLIEEYNQLESKMGKPHSEVSRPTVV